MADPTGFSGGDVNLFCYAGNSPLNNIDPTGLSWFSEAFNSVVNTASNVANDVSKWVNNTVQDVGSWVSDQWNDGTIQKIAMGAQFVVGALTMNPIMMASAGTALYESISGNTIGDGMLTRMLGVSNIMLGGFMGGGWSAGSSMFDTTANLSRMGLTGVGAYEMASGDQILGGTLSSVLYGMQLGTGTLPMALNSSLALGSRAIAGLQVGLGATSLAAGDSSLGRSVNIAGSLWAMGQNIAKVRGQSPDPGWNAAANAQTGFWGTAWESTKAFGNGLLQLGADGVEGTMNGILIGIPNSCNSAWNRIAQVGNTAITPFAGWTPGYTEEYFPSVPYLPEFDFAHNRYHSHVGPLSRNDNKDARRFWGMGGR